MSRVWAQWLTEIGFGVIVGNDSETALELIINEKPSLLMLDVLMPKKDGMRLASEIRATPSIATVSIIMMSGIYKDPTSRMQMKQVADDFIEKPFEKQQLLEKIAKFLPLPASAPSSAPKAQQSSSPPAKPAHHVPSSPAAPSAPSSRPAQTVPASRPAPATPPAAPPAKPTAPARPVGKQPNSPAVSPESDDEITDVHIPASAKGSLPTKKTTPPPSPDSRRNSSKTLSHDSEFSQSDPFSIDLPVFDDEITLIKFPDPPHSAPQPPQGSPPPRPAPAAPSTPPPSSSADAAHRKKTLSDDLIQRQLDDLFKSPKK